MLLDNSVTVNADVLLVSFILILVVYSIYSLCIYVNKFVVNTKEAISASVSNIRMEARSELNNQVNLINNTLQQQAINLNNTLQQQAVNLRTEMNTATISVNDRIKNELSSITKKFGLEEEEEKYEVEEKDEVASDEEMDDLRLSRVGITKHKKKNIKPINKNKKFKELVGSPDFMMLIISVGVIVTAGLFYKAVSPKTITAESLQKRSVQKLAISKSAGFVFLFAATHFSDDPVSFKLLLKEISHMWQASSAIAQMVEGLLGGVDSVFDESDIYSQMESHTSKSDVFQKLPTEMADSSSDEENVVLNSWERKQWYNIGNQTVNLSLNYYEVVPKYMTSESEFMLNNNSPIAKQDLVQEQLMYELCTTISQHLVWLEAEKRWNLPSDKYKRVLIKHGLIVGTLHRQWCDISQLDSLMMALLENDDETSDNSITNEQVRRGFSYSIKDKAQKAIDRANFVKTILFSKAGPTIVSQFVCNHKKEFVLIGIMVMVACYSIYKIVSRSGKDETKIIRLEETLETKKNKTKVVISRRRTTGNVYKYDEAHDDWVRLRDDEFTTTPSGSIKLVSGDAYTWVDDPFDLPGGDEGQGRRGEMMKQNHKVGSAIMKAPMVYSLKACNDINDKHFNIVSCVSVFGFIFIPHHNVANYKKLFLVWGDKNQEVKEIPMTAKIINVGDLAIVASNVPSISVKGFREPIKGEIVTFFWRDYKNRSQCQTTSTIGDRFVYGDDKFAIEVVEYKGSTEDGSCGGVYVANSDGYVVGFHGLGLSANYPNQFYPVNGLIEEKLKTANKINIKYDFDLTTPCVLTDEAIKHYRKTTPQTSMSKENLRGFINRKQRDFLKVDNDKLCHFGKKCTKGGKCPFKHEAEKWVPTSKKQNFH